MAAFSASFLAKALYLSIASKSPLFSFITHYFVFVCLGRRERRERGERGEREGRERKERGERGERGEREKREKREEKKNLTAETDIIFSQVDVVLQKKIQFFFNTRNN